MYCETIEKLDSVVRVLGGERDEQSDFKSAAEQIVKASLLSASLL